MDEAPDQRRKLKFEDYQRIHLASEDGLTIRAIASQWSVSTKYVRRILDRELLDIASGAIIWDSPIEGWNPHRCSGCNRPFETLAGLQSHFDFYLSGGQSELACIQTVPGR
jgi:hypothetical protein